MNPMKIREYELLSPFQTAGSGNARWCVARKNDKSYFLKQFLAPVQPVQTTEEPTQQVLLRRKKCEAFEQRKLALYAALQNVKNDCIISVDEFFVHEGHYYAASEYIDSMHQTILAYRQKPLAARVELLHLLAVCMHALHCAGVVHADIKPEHIIAGGDMKILWLRVLDFDSGFLESDPPDADDGMEVDPVYLSPEVYLLITGSPQRLSHKIDTFALGILFHQMLTGELPEFNREKYAYPYAAVLDGAAIALSPDLSKKQRRLIRSMLHKKPARRPTDKAIEKALRSML